MGLARRTGGAEGERCARAIGKTVTAVVLGVWLWRSIRTGWGLWRGCRCARTLLCAAGRWAITQVYSGDELVSNETLQDWRTHNGVDIACAENAPVKSAVAGTVCNIYDDGMWGRIVEVEADELTWRYAGLAADSVQVSVGDGVSAGQTLGNVGEVMAETAGGPHLHLEVLKGGNRVDPEHYFG